MHLLPRLYESLCRQTFTDFEWVIVDDGSTDGTKDLFHPNGNGKCFLAEIAEKTTDFTDNKFLAENSEIAENQIPIFSIRYFYQENGGKHRAINRGVKEAKGELFFIVDSDDMLPPEALEMVAKQYEYIKGDERFAGVAGFDAHADGQVIGHGNTNFDILECSPVDFWCKQKVSGDMKEVFKTKVLLEFPFPEIDGEKFCPEELIWIRISKKYILRYFNHVIYIADYLPDGLSAKLVKLRMDNPLTAMLDCKEYIEFGVPLRKSLKNAINYWRWYFCLSSNTKCYPKLSSIWYIVKPLGWLMHLNDLKIKK